jgi:hypothetical protein
MTLTPEDGDWP